MGDTETVSKKESIIAPERVMFDRIPELDFAKGICIIGLIMVHITEYIVGGVDTSFAFVLVEALGYPIGAPLFMFCMGMTLVFSRRKDARTLFERGFALLTVGFLLNILRTSVTLLPSVLIYGPDLLVSLVMFVGVDILQFAGMAFLTLALLEKLKVKSIGVLIVAVIMNFAGMLLDGVNTGFYPLDQALGYLWGTDTEAYFPLFNWFIFVAAGKLYGEYYVRIRNYKQWYKIVLPVGLVLSALYYALSLSGICPFFKIFTTTTGFMRMNILDAIGCLACVITFVGILWLFAQKFKWRGLCYISRNINKYYCTSYIFVEIGVVLAAVGIIPELGDIGIVILGVVFLGICTLVIMFYKRFMESWLAPWCKKHMIVLSIIIWAVAIGGAAYGFTLGTEYPNFLNNYLYLD